MNSILVPGSSGGWLRTDMHPPYCGRSSPWKNLTRRVTGSRSGHSTRSGITTTVCGSWPSGMKMPAPASALQTRSKLSLLPASPVDSNVHSPHVVGSPPVQNRPNSIRNLMLIVLPLLNA